METKKRNLMDSEDEQFNSELVPVGKWESTVCCNCSRWEHYWVGGKVLQARGPVPETVPGPFFDTDAFQKPTDNP